jgi:hypothetical protein
MSGDIAKYSIAVKLKRVTISHAYVRVPVTDEVMKTDANGAVMLNDKGCAGIDPAKLTQRAIELARPQAGKWYHESDIIEPHPLQSQLGPDEEYLA